MDVLLFPIIQKKKNQLNNIVVVQGRINALTCGLQTSFRSLRNGDGQWSSSFLHASSLMGSSAWRCVQQWWTSSCFHGGIWSWSFGQPFLMFLCS
ncbi:ORF110 [White spot syndrome virus]|uniref:Wsv215 n=4 Tax=White spot syndrome virus TaxID=342409 RepID=Q77J50_WSSVS|nr:wsv215 [Shrimp white spot syndrome virus]AAK77779.1 ORF110 [White spot syndrome virus]AYW76567.1 hypothetical protein [Procambarus clarkii virus]AAL33219.1 wsv215 [Shrimp white spot syndrome virus]AAL89138.1 WSSV270 [Shrimp white spot syndrome virus]AFX59592.1 wsv215 [White spot syndrome virus]